MQKLISPYTALDNNKESTMIRLRVKEVAKEKGISQSKLGRLADVDVKTMRRIYTEPTTPLLTTTLDRIAKALKVDASTLIESVPDEE
jgi:DNA-binding Xre family transcriptional regulator